MNVEHERMLEEAIWPVLKYFSGIYLHLWRNNTEIFRLEGLFPGQVLKWTAFKYKAEVLPPKTSCLVSIHIAIIHDLLNVRLITICVLHKYTNNCHSLAYNKVLLSIKDFFCICDHPVHVFI